MIVFFDAQKKPISPGKNWPVTLRWKQSKLRFTPQSFEVQPASPTGSAVLFPVWFGNDTVEAVVANYSPEPLTIVITGWLVLGLCLGGGAAGGLAAYDKFKGSWIWRIFIGILGGAVLCWRPSHRRGGDQHDILCRSSGWSKILGRARIRVRSRRQDSGIANQEGGDQEEVKGDVAALWV